MSIQILGIHSVEGSEEPCHLLHVVLPADAEFDWGEVTQEVPGQPRSNWQVAYDEQPLDDSRTRWAFFFHYLDFNKPLLTPFGAVDLVPATPLPNQLRHIQYESPC